MREIYVLRSLAKSTFSKVALASTAGILLVVYLTFGVVGKVTATPLSPPSGFQADTGVNFFLPGSTVLVFELVDTLESITQFGFYFKNAPGNLIPLFDALDLTVNGDQVAAAGFIVGQVFDIDEGGGSPELLFSTSPGPIGFYLGIGGTTVFSDELLNPGGLDLFSAFQSATDPSVWAFVFEGVAADGSLVPINSNLVVNVSSVPEPSMIALLAMGFAAMVVGARRRRSIKAQDQGWHTTSYTSTAEVAQK